MAHIPDRFIQILRQSMADRLLIEIYTDARELDRFCVGVVHGCSDELFGLSEVDLGGRPDEFSVHTLDSVIRIGTKNNYLHNLQKAFDAHAKPNEFACPVGEWSDCLGYLKEHRFAASFCDTSGTKTRGFVHDYDDTALAIRKFRSDFTPDGIEWMRISDLEAVRFRGAEQSILDGMTFPKIIQPD